MSTKLSKGKIDQTKPTGISRLRFETTQANRYMQNDTVKKELEIIDKANQEKAKHGLDKDQS